MINWLVPLIWVLGVIYSIYSCCIGCQEEMKAFGDKAKMAMEDDPIWTVLVVLLITALLLIVAFVWPVIVLMDVGRGIYHVLKGEST